MKKISSKFSNLENWWFSLKITQLCREPQERGFVAQSSWGHHSKGFCPYFQVYKPKSTSELSAHIRHTMCISKKFNINFFPLSQHIAKLLKKYCIKTFPIAPTLFFSKTSEKVGFLEKKYALIRDTWRCLWFCEKNLRAHDLKKKIPPLNDDDDEFGPKMKKKNFVYKLNS